jgi:Sec-independent protein secretion pathway component TatC
MYVVLILVLAFVIAIGTVWAPIFALIIAVPLFVLFLVFVGFSRRSDETETGSSGAPVTGEGGDPQHGGIWGEKTPDA